MRSVAAALAAVLIALMAAACGGGNSGGEAPEATTAGAPEGTTVATLEPVTVELLEVNKSGQSGMATLTDKGLSGTGVVLKVSPPERFPGDAQEAAIHGAPCAEIRKLKGFESLAPTVAQELGTVRDGQSESTAAKPVAELTTGGYSIAVHQQDPPYRAVACGDIPKR